MGASNSWSIHQVDVKTVFLYGVLPDDETCFMEQPESVAELGFPANEWVWELQKGLYGMKQAGQLWNKTMHNRMLELGFTQHPSDPCIYYRKNKDGLILTGIHVNDYIITGNNDAGIAKFKDKL